MSSMQRTLGLALLVGALSACRDTTMDQPDTSNPGTDGSMTGDATADMGVREAGPMMEGGTGNEGGTGSETGGGDARPSVSITIAQLQNPMDSMHPSTGSYVTLMQSGMVALTPRMVIGSTTPSAGGSCTFAVWVGDGMTGNYHGVVVREQVPFDSDAGDCFSVTGKIPANITPGTTITSITEASYSESCGGPSGTTAAMCDSWAYTTAFLGGRAAFNVGAMGTVQTPTDTNLAETGQTQMSGNGVPGTRTPQLEGTLIRLSNVITGTAMETTSGGTALTVLEVHQGTDTAHTLRVDAANFRSAACVRGLMVGRTLPSLTGVLTSSFGQWRIKLWDIANAGLTTADCATDGGTATDASTTGG